MKRSPLLTALCMRNLANALRQGTITVETAALALDELAAEVDPAEDFTVEDARMVLDAIRKEETDGRK